VFQFRIPRWKKSCLVLGVGLLFQVNHSFSIQPSALQRRPTEVSQVILSPTLLSLEKQSPEEHHYSSETEESFEKILNIYTQTDDIISQDPKFSSKDAPFSTPASLENPGTASKTHLIGLLLPLSQQHAPLGLAFLRAAIMALFEAGNPHLSLLPLDTKGSPEGTQKAVEKGIAQGVTLFLGPIFAPEIRALQKMTSSINMIAFSNDQTLAQKGTYLLTFFPETYIIRVLDSALEYKDAPVLLLVPSNKYGEIITKTFTSYMKSHRKKPMVLKYNLEHPNTIVSIVAKIKETHPYFLLIPQGPPALNALLNQLEVQGLDLASYKLLGGDQWYTSEILEHPATQGALFASPNPQMYQAFKEKYIALYGISPPIIAALMYDAVWLAAVLENAHPHDPFSQEYLTMPGGFSGLTGIFRFSENGKIQRQLETIEVRLPEYR